MILRALVIAVLALGASTGWLYIRNDAIRDKLNRVEAQLSVCAERAADNAEHEERETDVENLTDTDLLERLAPWLQ